jgi:hypothetical protein
MHLQICYHPRINSSKKEICVRQGLHKQIGVMQQRRARFQ